MHTLRRRRNIVRTYIQIKLKMKMTTKLMESPLYRMNHINVNHTFLFYVYNVLEDT